MEIAFVCLGNICRSPMAEAVCRVLLDQAGLSGRVTVESFGTAGYHAGQGAEPQTDAALARHGWPHGSHRARRIERADLRRLDLVLCADRANLADVRRLAGAGAGERAGGDWSGGDTTGGDWSGGDATGGDWAGGDAAGGHATGGGVRIRLLRSYDPAAPDGAEVPDPWGRADAAFDEALAIVERACRGLVTSLVAALPADT